MSDFTPGPWQWVETPSAHSLDYPHDTPEKVWDGVQSLGRLPAFDELRGGNGEPVLTGVWCNDSTAEIGVEEANARLIAAAPELVAALEELIGKVVFRTSDGDRLCFVCGEFGDPDDREPMPHDEGCEVAAHASLLARIKGESNE